MDVLRTLSVAFAILSAGGVGLALVAPGTLRGATTALPPASAPSCVFHQYEDSRGRLVWAPSLERVPVEHRAHAVAVAVPIGE